MFTSTTSTETIQLHATSGCGTLESPWLGWESQLERSPTSDGPQTVMFARGFWGVSRTVQLRNDLRLLADPKEDGHVWLLPVQEERAAPLDSLLLVDGVHRLSMHSICFNGRGQRARTGLHVRCGTRIHLEHCRFGDFKDAQGSAIRVAGESEERFAREVVIQSCRFQNGERGIRLGRNTSDLLINENRFEEIVGASLLVDPEDTWTDYGLIFVRNRVTWKGDHRPEPHVRVLPGAEGIRLAENTIEGPETGIGASPSAEPSAFEVRGGGPMSRRRLEFMLNRVVGNRGPGLSARQCGPGFIAAGNLLMSCGLDGTPAMDLHACTGILVEDNEISEIEEVGIRIRDCAKARINGNEIVGTHESKTPRQGTVGVLLEGEGLRRIRLTDNRIRSVKNEGISVRSGRSVRLTGNEVEDCGLGIHVGNAQHFVIVGNDCRDNSDGGIKVEQNVKRGFVSLNYAILNGPVDLEVFGERVRCRNNKVDRRGTPEDYRPNAGLTNPA